MVNTSTPRYRRWALTTLAAAATSVLIGCGDGQEDDHDSTAEHASTQRAQAQAATPAVSGGIVINEISAASWKGATDADGDSEDWVELYNPGNAVVDLSGYGLSNKPASPFLWTFPAGTQIPAKGYLTVWLSKKDRAVAGAALHANFNLDNGADSLFLSASNATTAGILIDSATPPMVKTDQTWCRMPIDTASTATAFNVCLQPTPGTVNKGTAFATVLNKPAFSVGSGFYAGAQTVSLTGPAGATIRYTTDGSEPTATSAAYSAPITVSASTVLRAAAFSANAESSLVETSTYIIDAALAGRYANLRAVMMTMPPADLTRFNANDAKLSSRASFEMLTGATTSVFKVDAQASVAGQLGSTDSPQRSTNVSLKDAFGVKSIKASLWPEKPAVTSVKKFRLRNGSNDWASAHLRDQLSQSAGPGPNLISSSSSVAMFINGKYYGLMDLREREEESLVSGNLGVDDDFVDYLYDPLLNAQEIKNGGAKALSDYSAMNSFITGNDMSVASHYAKAKTLLNPESLAWDWALHMFHANYDWPHRNVHVWRSPEIDGRWTWHAHDMDFAFGRYASVSQDMNGSYTGQGSAMMQALLKSPEFRNLYLNTLADQMNLMTPARMSARLDVMRDEMRPYIADFYAKNNLGTEANWVAQLTNIRNWIAQREGYHDLQVRNHFGLGSRIGIDVAVNDRTMGTVQVNALDTVSLTPSNQSAWSGRYYPGVPIQLVAKPRPGYTFVGWQGASTSTAAAITYTGTPVTSVNADAFSARWSGQVQAPTTGSYQFQTVSDDGVRLWVNGQLVIDNWTLHGDTVNTSAAVTLQAGQRYDIKMEYFDNGGGATAKLQWQTPGVNGFTTVPSTVLYASASAAQPAGLTGSYFNNPNMTGAPAAQTVEVVNYAWGNNAPAPQAAGVGSFKAVFAPTATVAAPVFPNIPAQSAKTGDVITLATAATDPAGLQLTYSAKKLPKGVNINAQTGVVFGRITTPGVYSATITASNGTSSSNLALTWTVTDRPGTGLLGTSPDNGTTPGGGGNGGGGGGNGGGGNGGSGGGNGGGINTTVPGRGLWGQYFATPNLTGVATLEREEAINFDWGGGAPATTVPADNFSVRWSGSLLASSTGAHQFQTLSDDGVRVWVNGKLVIDNWTAHAPALNTSAPVYMKAGQVVPVVVEYQEFGGGATMRLNWRTPNNTGFTTVPAAQLYTATVAANSAGREPVTAGSVGTGLRGQYFASNNLTGAIVLERTEGVNFNWGLGAPAPSVSADHFSMRWSGEVVATAAGNHVFQTSSDDGVRVWIDGRLVIDNWTAHPETANTSAAIAMTAGQRATVVVEYQEYGGYAVMQLRWQTPGSTAFVPVPTTQLYPTATPL